MGIPDKLRRLHVFAASCVALACVVVSGRAQVAYPQAEISNGPIHARLYLPDPQNGYYAKRGKDAIDGAPDALQQLEAIKQKVHRGATEP